MSAGDRNRLLRHIVVVIDPVASHKERERGNLSPLTKHARVQVRSREMSSLRAEGMS